jgi:hypothetical protein
MARPRAVSDRLGPGDLMELAADVGPVPLNVGALLVLDAPGDRSAMIAEVLARRARRVPRLGQRLQRSGPWRRPVWVEAGEDARGRIDVRACSAPADRDALLEDAAGLLVTRLPLSGPLWRATLLIGLPGDRCAVVVVMHHVLADGMGGLAVLQALADGAEPKPAAPQAAAPPAGTGPTPGGAPRPALRHALGELGGGRPRRAPTTSLNRPTGPHRALRTADVDLAGVRATARAAGATVNDVLLVAVTGAVRAVLDARGEAPAELVVSVPVSARSGTHAGDLGNRVGVMPVRVPMAGTSEQRLRAVAAQTAQRRSAGTRGSSAALMAPVFRVLARTGLLRAVIDRQRLVNLFVTNLRGPAQPLTIAGAPVLEVVPLSSTQGNVAVAFAALSYAGRLTVTALLDPDVVAEAGLLREALQSQLAALASPPA